jgi:2-polyprenyl-6-methoxyphenol hydroxylase-like FAD-dependent oxidoreductase
VSAVDRSVDVVVVGGGPAGATIATRLAQLGHCVAVIERGATRRSHRFETLAAGTLDLLDVSGAGRAVRMIPARELSAIERAWDGPRAQGRLAPGSLAIDRDRFDAALRDHAAASGVEVCCPAVATAITPAGDGWSVSTDDRSTVTGRFLVDATGRSAGPAGSRSTTSIPSTLAVTRCWTGDVPHEPVIATTDDGWVWCAPAPHATGGCEVTAFVDRDAWRSLPGGRAACRYERIVSASGVVGAGAIVTGRLRTSVASAALATDLTGHARLRVGDAAMALDPLSSTGVLAAVRSGLAAAVVVHTVLTRPGDASLALDHHRRAVASAWDHHEVWTTEAYAAVAAVRPTDHWRSRARALPGAGTPTVPTPSRASFVPRASPERVVRRSADVRFVGTTHVLADRIAPGTAVEHPGLDGAVAYVGGTPIVPLLRTLDGAAPLGDIVTRWAETVPLATAVRIADWLLRRGVLEGVDAA